MRNQNAYLCCFLGIFRQFFNTFDDFFLEFLSIIQAVTFK